MAQVSHGTYLGVTVGQLVAFRALELPRAFDMSKNYNRPKGSAIKKLKPLVVIIRAHGVLRNFGIL